MAKRVHCLYRVSTLKQVEKDDIPMQKQACREFAERQGWVIVGETSEKGVSGFKVSAKDRDAIQDIQADAVSGKFDILLVFMFDRLGRREDETPFVVEWFVRNGIEVWSTQEGQQRFDSHVDKLMNYIRYWQASGESIKTSIRTKTRLAQIVEEGRFRGGIAPFGFRLEKQGRLNKKGHGVNEIVIDDTEAVVVRLIFNKYLNEGYGSQRICTFLQEQNITNRAGSNFTNTTIQHILKNVVYIGVLRSGETYSAPFPELEIIDKHTFERVQEMLKQRSVAFKERNIPLRTKGQGLLSGSLYCGHCGGRLIQTSNVYRRPKADGTKVEHIRLRYVCYNKTRHPHLCDGQTGYTVGRVDELVETLVLEMLGNAQNSPRTALLDSQYKEHMANIKGNLRRAESALSKYETNLEVLKKELLAVIKGESILDRATLNETIAETKAGLEKATSDVAHWQSELGKGETVAEELSTQFRQVMTWASAYSTSAYDEKKMIIAQIVERIHLKRGYETNVELKINYNDFCTDISEDTAEGFSLNDSTAVRISSEDFPASAEPLTS